MLHIFNSYNFRTISQLQYLPDALKDEIEILAKVFPFKTNNYVVDELIDWEHAEIDPIFRLNFPGRQMLKPTHFEKLRSLYSNKTRDGIANVILEQIWQELNPHPAGQLDLNIPFLNGKKLKGLQHKYKETVLFFPSQGQTCHAYCTFCFRWPQFIGIKELKFALKETDILIEYLRNHKQVTDLLITGGDPMIMGASQLGMHLNAILDANISHLKTIRIGTKALSYWPYRFVSDPDTPELLKLFRRVTKAGKHLAIMAHISHPVELSTQAVYNAIKNIHKTGARIRSQSPLLNHINANASIWAKLWKDQVNLGIIPYYMFIARDTGAQKFFRVSLHDAWRIFRDAYAQVSGLARTVRGPSMSCEPGKIQIVGVSNIGNEKVFALNFLQARDNSWTGRPFFARFDKNAYWLNDLKPAFGEREFFYEKDFQNVIQEKMNEHQFDPDEDIDTMSMCS